MKRLTSVERLTGFMLLAGIIGSLGGPQVALASQESVDASPPVVANQDEPATEPTAIPEQIDLSSRFPVKQGQSGDSYEFDVTLDYRGSETKVFRFDLDTPDGWQASIQQQFAETAQTVLAQTLQPNQTYPPSVTITFSPLPGEVPATGEYPLTFTATSGDLSGSIQLRAVVTSVPIDYAVEFTSNSGRLDFPVRPGDDNPISFRVTNTGTGEVTNISFTSVKSEGWGTTFSPSITESLAPGESMDVSMVLTPPEKTIAGDYNVLVRVGADSPDVRLQEQLELRIRVQTSSTWGAVGIIIAVAVIVGLAMMFRQLGRR